MPAPPLFPAFDDEDDDDDPIRPEDACWRKEVGGTPERKYAPPAPPPLPTPPPVEVSLGVRITAGEYEVGWLVKAL